VGAREAEVVKLAATHARPRETEFEILLVLAPCASSEKRRQGRYLKPAAV